VDSFEDETKEPKVEDETKEPKDPKSMSILYQMSITVVYTHETHRRILYAVTQKTPIACIPGEYKKSKVPTEMHGGMPQKEPQKGSITTKLQPKKKEAVAVAVAEAVAKAEGLSKSKLKMVEQKKLSPAEAERRQREEAEAAERRQREEAAAAERRQREEAEAAERRQRAEEAEELITSPYTLFATYKRVASYGALFAGKMMEYFFGGERGYYQLPYFFRNFDKFLKVCHQYDSTVLMYLPNVSPYNLLLSLPSGPDLLLDSIGKYFSGLGINDTSYIRRKLTENIPHIQAIFKFLTGDFMVDPGILDETVSSSQGSSQDSLHGSESSTGSMSSMSSTSSGAIGYFLLGPLDKEGDGGSSWSQSLGNSQSLQYLSSQGSQEDMDGSKGGTLPIKYHIKKSITTRKKKNKNKSRTKTKSITPVRRVTIRIKRMMKSKGSKVTKPRTYKRRAPGGKRKSKPNKTMRRYRRVRK
jgi:hypothetical protein